MSYEEKGEILAVLHAYAKPRAKERPRFNRSTGTAFTPATTKKAEKEQQSMFLGAWGKNRAPIPTDVPLRLYFQFFISKPKTVTREFPTVRPDVDNMVKLTLDAMIGPILEDDGNVIDIIAEKRYADKDYIKVTIVRAQHG